MCVCVCSKEGRRGHFQRGNIFEVLCTHHKLSVITAFLDINLGEALFLMSILVWLINHMTLCVNSTIEQSVIGNQGYLVVTMRGGVMLA